MPLHRNASTADQLHIPFVSEASDPGAIGAYKAWYEPSTGILRIRNAANDGWVIHSREPTITTETTATYTVSIDDWGAHVRLTDASEVVVTVPEDASDDLPIGMTVLIEQAGDGPVVIEPETSVPVIHALGGADTTEDQYAVVTLTKVAADEWVLHGGLLPPSV